MYVYLYIKQKKLQIIFKYHFFFFFFLKQKSESSGKVAIQLISFSNIQDFDYNGNCCNGDMLILNNSSNPLCSQECNTLINICLDNYQRYLYLELESKQISTYSLIQTNYRKSSSNETKSNIFLSLLVKSYQKLKNRLN